VPDDRGHGLFDADLIELLIAVVEECDVSDAERPGRRRQFAFANARQRRVARMVRAAGSVTEVPPAISACGRHQVI
jgi:hypothetical protein